VPDKAQALICSYDEACVLPALFDSLLNQRAGADVFLIIFVDNASVDQTKEVVSSYAAKLNAKHI